MTDPQSLISFWTAHLRPSRPTKGLTPSGRMVSAEPLEIFSIEYNMDVSQNRGTPKWMVYNGKPY